MAAEAEIEEGEAAEAAPKKKGLRVSKKLLIIIIAAVVVVLGGGAAAYLFLFSAPPRLAFFDCGGVRLMLSTPEPDFDHPGSVLYFAVDDIWHMHETLTARGVIFVTEPHKIATLADRDVWLADFRDTEGNVLALMSEPRFAVAQAAR